jgi:hypothetical protein
MATIKQLSQSLRAAQKKLKIMEAKANDQKALVGVLRDEMSDLMKEAGISAFSGRGIRIAMRESVVPQVTDWKKVYRFIKKNDAFDLFQRRLASTAWKDRMEDRKAPIPGVEAFEKTTLYITLKED